MKGRDGSAGWFGLGTGYFFSLFFSFSVPYFEFLFHFKFKSVFGLNLMHNKKSSMHNIFIIVIYLPSHLFMQMFP
jgi:hypothetical protein